MSTNMLRLYRQMLRSGSRLRDNNVRVYTLSNIRDRFREHKDVTEPGKLRRIVLDAQHSLGVIRRQASLQGLYDEGDRFINDWQK
jgi:hypothetical protein